MQLVGLCHSFKSTASPPCAFGFGTPRLGDISIKYKIGEREEIVWDYGKKGEW